jgi:hypothetical protein
MYEKELSRFKLMNKKFLIAIHQILIANHISIVFPYKHCLILKIKILVDLRF